MAYKTFVNGFPLNASEINNNLMSQVISTFADSAARAAAISAPIEGQVTYLESDEKYYKFNGSSWVELAGMQEQVSQALSPNYIINGAFDIWQRGTSFTPNTASTTFSADRWAIGNTTDTQPTISQQAFTPAEVNATGYGEGQLYTRIAFANNQTGSRNFSTSIEDVRTLAGQTATYSFWAKASSSVSMQTTIWQEFGSGGSAIASPGNVTYTIGTSWQRYTFTVEMPSISGKTIGAGSKLTIIPFRYSTATDLLGGVTLDIWGVQLEAGSVATPFKRNAPSLQGELAACMPYFTRIESTGDNDPIANGFANSTTQVFSSINFPVPMRTTPTFSTSGVASQFEILRQGTSIIACSSLPTLSTASKLSANVVFTVSSGLSAGEGVVARQDSGSFLDFSAEL